ncbi:MAG: hypothetical protein NXI04_24195 [Planctomycetaceae bacterium]|nr:hypothetical protein [Planctomycetaceae bacterium]
METSPRPAIPLWFKICNSMFLLWNAFGLVVFLLFQTVYTTKEALTEAGLTEAQVELTLATPGWVHVAFGLAVIFGVLGSIAMLMKSSLTIPLLLISLIGVLAQNTYVYLLSDTVKVMGVGASPFVIVGAIAVIPYAIYGSRKHWINRLHPD